MAVSGPAIIPKKSGAKHNLNPVVPGSANSDGRQVHNMTNPKHKMGSLKNKLVHKGGNQHAVTAMAQRIPLVEKPRHFGMSEAEFHALEASPNSHGGAGGLQPLHQQMIISSANSGGKDNAGTTSKLANLTNPVL